MGVNYLSSLSDSLRILRRMKNAVKHNTVLASNVMKRKISDILASFNPAGNVQKCKGANYENNKLKYPSKFALRRACHKNCVNGQ